MQRASAHAPDGINDPPARTWLQKTFDDIEAAIRARLIWSSEIITGEPQQGTRH